MFDSRYRGEGQTEERAMGKFGGPESSGGIVTDRDGNRIEIIEAYLTTDKVLVRKEDGSTKAIRIRDIRR